MEIISCEDANNEQFGNIYFQQVSIETAITRDPTLNTRIHKRRKSSFVWHYFLPLDSSDSSSLQCRVCGTSVSKQTSNLARHLLNTHGISRAINKTDKQNKRSAQNRRVGRPSKSFIWKYCTKENSSYSRCHLCDKLLYFGCGNTSNISKHLRRKHSSILSKVELGQSRDMEDTEEFISIISSNQMDGTVKRSDEEENKVKEENIAQCSRLRKERKGSSYVWNYCDKLSRHAIRCKLCKKMMSFHGTANVITHLQRRHNIVGGAEFNTTIMNTTDEDSLIINMKDDPEASVHSHNRSSAAKSVVWKYCTRLSQDVVRCSFCKKDLSFQGTSNLQRHLHRMHGIVTQGRGFGELEPTVDIDDNFIWDYCEHTEDKIKCNMCNKTFDGKGFEEIRRHITHTHAVLSHPTAKRRKRCKRNDRIEETSDEADEYDYLNEDETSQGVDTEFNLDCNDIAIKKDTPSFEDIIEEDHDEQINCDEDPFDPKMMQDFPEVRPLSLASSRDTSPDRPKKMSTERNTLRKLNDERLRMETEYFREKAGYYRMQKYFIALQAKKARIELERLQSSGSGEIAYQANIDMTDAHTSTTNLLNKK